MKNKLPPEITGKYPKKYASRIQDANLRLNFGIYKDRGRNRKKIQLSSPALSGHGNTDNLPPVLHSYDVHVVPDLPKFEEKNGQLVLLYPVDKNSIDHSLTPYGTDIKSVGAASIIVTQLTLFSGPLDQKVTVPASMVQSLIERYFVPMSHHEQVQSYLSGIKPPEYVPLPIAQIADCRFTRLVDMQIAPEERSSFRDNLR